ncbi:MAG: hypothetical protein CL908_11245 [Deltaproteobacteria bacterium]|nr:hypothetical protein [Deltaproteobacteria bacterium]
MPTLGPEHLVFNTTNIVGAGVREIVTAAAAGGYDAISIWPQDLYTVREEGLGEADVRKLIEDAGLVVADVDCLLTWSELVKPEPGQAMVELVAEREFFEIAEALGARSINLTQGFGSELDYDRAAEDLARVCDRAAEHGLLVTYEFLPWTGVPNVAAALDLISRTGRNNATIMFDSWHWFRGGADLEMLRDIPGEKIGSTQWNDAPKDAWSSLPEEAMQGRLKPGEGDIPLIELVRVLNEIGSRAPTGVEVINAEHETMDPARVGRETAAAMRRLLAEAQEH